MYIIMIILIVFASLLMCGIVLIQESKGGGLASSFSSSNQIMGVRKTTDFLEKGTWFLAAFMVVCSIICAYVIPQPKSSDSAILNDNTPTAPAANGMNGAQTQQTTAPVATPQSQGGNNTTPQQAAGQSTAPAAPLKAPASPAK